MKAVGVFAALAFVFIFSTVIWKDFKYKSRRDEKAVVQEGQDQMKELLSLGAFRKIPGAQMHIAALGIEAQMRSRISELEGYSYGKSRNYLLLEPVSKKLHWIFPTNKFHIISTFEVSQSGEGDKVKIVSGFLFTVLDADTNLDSRIDENDRSSVYAYHLQSGKLTQLIKNVDVVTGVFQISAAEALVSYNSSNQSFLQTVNLKDWTLGAELKVDYML